MTDASRVNAYERQAHESRRRLASTLDELADNLTPGRVLDEVMSYARGGGGSFLKSLGNAATANPIPVALIGISAAMFLTGRGRVGASGSGESRGAAVLRHAADRMSAPGQSKHSVVNDAGAAASQAVRSAGSAIGDGAATVGAAASGAVDAMGSAASSIAGQASAGVAAVGSMAVDAMEQVREGAAVVGDAVTDAGQKAAGVAALSVQRASEAVGEIAATTRKTVVEVGAGVIERGNRISDDVGWRARKLLEEQPLLVAAAGLAIGAAVAAALPRTKAEDSLMGDTSDAVKEAVGQVASDQIAAAKSTAETVAKEVKKTATEVGASPAAAASVVLDLGDRLKKAVGAGKGSLENGSP